MSKSSIGVQFQFSVDSGTTYTTVGVIVDIDYPGATKDVKESTGLSQTSRWKTFFGAFVDAGEATLTVDWDKAKFNTLSGHLPDPDPIKFRIVVPDGSDPLTPTTCSTLVFDGLVSKGWGLTFPKDGDRVTWPLNVKFSGAPTYTPAP
jgi:hypothetical protein